MKRILLLLCFIMPASFIFAQYQKQTDTTVNRVKPLISVERVNLLKNVDMIANMQYGLLNEFSDGDYTDSRFSMNQFRLEIKGKVFDNVYFRFRDRYTRNTVPQSLDGISHSTDMAFIQIDVTKKWSLAFGKMCADWGGYEFDLNPIDIYAYNDIVEYADNFLSGVQASYAINDNHKITAQVLNSRTQFYKDLYDTIPNVTQAKFPAAGVINWRGNFGKGLFTTIWSYSLFVEAHNKVMNYVALGNQLNLKKFTITYDFKWSDEDIDRKTIVTTIVPDSYDPYAALDVRYVEHWLRAEYRFHPRWNVSVIGMVSDAYWFGNPDPNKDSHLRTSWGVIPAVEFFPFKNLNLKFFGSYVGRYYNYTDYAKRKFGSVNNTTGVFTLGFISPLVIL